MQKDSNLRAVLSKFELSNLDLAKATGIDPSLISRYISGNRKLRKTSRQAEDIAEYLMTLANTSERIKWLTEQFTSSDLPMDFTSVLGMKRNLIQWITMDESPVSDIMSENLDTDDPIEEESDNDEQNKLAIGILPIVSVMNEKINKIGQSESLDLFLTSDRLHLITNEAFLQVLRRVYSEKKRIINIVICVSAETQYLNSIVQTYMREMVAGTIRFYTFFGSTKNVAEQLVCIFSNSEVAIITEASGGSSYPVGTFIHDRDFAREISQSFDATYRYSQPMFNIITDEYTRSMIEALYCEYCLPGALSVVKDSVNPMYMSFEDYCRVLRDRYPVESEYAWRCTEFRRFRDGFDSVLENGMICREIISLKRLKAIISERKCKMAGVYFLGKGFFDLDLQGCRDILAGYIRYLNRYPNFSLLILDDLPELHSSNCWHIKENQDVYINDWNGDAPVMCLSNHGILIQEFSRHYEEIWKRGSGSLKNRAYVISILQGIIQKMDSILETV